MRFVGVRPLEVPLCDFTSHDEEFYQLRQFESEDRMLWFIHIGSSAMSVAERQIGKVLTSESFRLSNQNELL